MKREAVITIPYIKDLSVNHYLGRRKGGGYYVKKEVKDWQEELGWMVKPYHIEDWRLPISVRCNALFSDNRIRDLSNFSKVVLDAIEETTGVNDTNMRWHDGWIVNDLTEKPVLQLVIEEGG